MAAAITLLNSTLQAPYAPQAEWRIVNRIAAAAAIMINTANKIPGFIEVSVHRALGCMKNTPERGLRYTQL